jgi:hypothetical protein
VNELVIASLQFPTVVFTIALGIVLAYWLFVLLGALDIDLLGHGHADIDVHIDGDVDADVDAGGLWHGLGLGAVPVTISVSLIALLSWLTALLVSHYAITGGGWAAVLVLVGAVVIAVPIAALLARPLAPVFAVKEGKSNADYIGHVCTVTTGRVDDGFGQATIEDGGTVLIIAVRCDRPGVLARGDRALIIDFDRERSAYLVEPSFEPG